MIEQADLYDEMAATLLQLSEGQETKAGIEVLKTQIAVFRELRAKTAALPVPTEEEVLRLSQLKGQQDARVAFLKAERTLARSEYRSPQILDVLSGLHDSVPVKGEGNP